MEMGRASARSFRAEGGVGLSPVGNYPDWKLVPEPKRRAFEQLAACAARDPSLITGEGAPPGRSPGAAPGSLSPDSPSPDSPSPGSPSPNSPSPDSPARSGARSTGDGGAAGPPLPHRLILGAALGAAAIALRWRESRDLRLWVSLSALLAATLVVRLWLVPAAFFHPNGQGAFWVAFALQERGDLASYGPGFWEVFGRVARLPWASPERLVFGAQALLGAASPVFAWALAREAGAHRRIAWGVAAAVAASPLLARMSQSQSYYGVYTSLLFAAAALLMTGSPRQGTSGRPPADDAPAPQGTSGGPPAEDAPAPQGTSGRPPAEGARRAQALRFGLSVVAAGLLVAQAARVTPIGWLPAAAVPLVLLAKPGALAAKIRWTAIAALGIGAIVAATSGPAMASVLRGSLGAQWLPAVRPAVGFAFSHDLQPIHAALAVIAAASPVLASRRRAEAAARATALLALIAAADASCMVRADTATFQRAYFAMWAPAALPLVVALAADLRSARLRAIAIAASFSAAFALHVRAAREDLPLPTNVLEAAWMETLREALPRDATVVYLSRAGRSVLALPLYVGTRVPGEPFTLGLDDALPEPSALGHDVYYYESSLCAAPEAEDACRTLRGRFGREVVATRTLPARSSAPTSFFRGPTVDVTLYRAR